MVCHAAHKEVLWLMHLCLVEQIGPEYLVIYHKVRKLMVVHLLHTHF